MRLLVHLCCANCSLYPLKSLMARGIDVKGLWFNPNIHPEPEYDKRLDSVRVLDKMWDIGIEYHDNYAIDAFLSGVGPSDENRCERCYSLRLDETAKTAKKMGLDGFTTTLLVSPYQRFDTIIAVGREMGKRHSVPFYVEDFRVGYRDSVPLSKELGLYRQKYCGCLYSEAERKAGRRNG